MYCFTALQLNSNLNALTGSIQPQLVTSHPYVLFTAANGDSLYSVTITSILDGSILAAVDNHDGTFTAYGSGRDSAGTMSYFLLWLDYQGQLLRTRFYSALSPGYFYSARGLVALPDGHLAFANQWPDALSNINLGLLRTDANGNVLARKMYGSIDDDFGRVIIPASDGSYVALGLTLQGSTVTNNFYRHNYWLLKLKANGDTISTHVVGSMANREEGFDIKQTSDGGYILAGAYTANQPNAKRQGQVVKLDANFNQQWQVKITPAAGNQQAGCELYAVHETAAGEYIVAGSFVGANFRNNGYVARLNQIGSVMWSQQYDPSNAENEIFYSMIYEPSGVAKFSGLRASGSEGIYAVQLSGLPTPYLPNYCITPPTADFSYHFSNDTLYLTDSSRTHLPYDVISRWEWDFGGWTSHKEGQLHSIYFPPGQQTLGNYIRLIVTNNLFCTDTLTYYPWGQPPTATQEHVKSLEVKLYPNPAKDQVTIALSPAAEKEALLQLYNSSGQVVRLQTLQPGQNQLSLHELPQGLYLWHIYLNGQHQTGKLVRK